PRPEGADLRRESPPLRLRHGGGDRARRGHARAGPARAGCAGAGGEAAGRRASIQGGCSGQCLGRRRAATDRRRLGWILGYLREDVVHSNYRDHAGLLPEGSARELLRQFYARYELAQAAALEDLRREWVPPPVDDVAWEDHLRWLALRDVRFSRELLLRRRSCSRGRGSIS